MSFDPQNEETQFLYTDEVAEDLVNDSYTDFEEDERVDSFSAADDFDTELSAD